MYGEGVGRGGTGDCMLMSCVSDRLAVIVSKQQRRERPEMPCNEVWPNMSYFHLLGRLIERFPPFL